MANKHKILGSVSDRALEMVMRDVLDSLSEISLESGFKPSDGGFEIIDIHPARHDNSSHRKKSASDKEGEILQFPDQRQATG